MKLKLFLCVNIYFLILLTEQLLIYRLYFYLYFLAQDFIQPFDLLYEVAGIDSYVGVRVDIYPLESNDFKTIFFRAVVPEWKQKLLNCFTSADLKIVTYIDQDSGIETDIKIDSYDRNALIIQEIPRSPDEIPRIFNIKNFMFFKAHVKQPPTFGLYESFKANLTSVGTMQKAILEKQLLASHKMYIDCARIYAPFTSLIQSSGTGKSKLCVEILSNYPGIYSVFRKQGESTGIPNEASWMKDMFNYVIKADADELPIDIRQLLNCQAIKFTPTKFLIALHAMIVSYYKFFQKAYAENSNSRSLALKKIGEHFQNNPIETDTNSIFKPHFPETDARKVSEVLADISCFLRGEVTEQKAEMYNLNQNIINLIMKPDINSNFPFLLFLDEADYLNEMTARGRLPGVHIVRRALHLLDADTRLLTVAIGTNSDVMDFTPLVNDNSLRYITRKELLPPITLCCNWEIFSNKYPLENLEMTKERLQSGNSMFKLLVSMGRPLWSSCFLSKVILTCEAKLKNGDPFCTGARMAVLLVRSNTGVNNNHILSRSLVRSYMALVNYVSTDGRGIKIAYSSEPVLAMAARNLLKDHELRELSFRSMKMFLEQQAIDKGRIVENVFEHFTLFAIDDADSEPNIFPENSENFPKKLRPLIDCDSHLLKLQEPEETVTIMESLNLFISDNYRLVRVGNYLRKYLEPGDFDLVKPFISENILSSFINATHFVKLERMKPNSFAGLKFALESTQDTGANVIDRNILKAGLLRQCGFVMPSNYPGLDKFLPILLDTAQTNGRPIYSFIGFQTKSSIVSLPTCTAKIASWLHVVKCPIHRKSCPSNYNHKSSCLFKNSELGEIYSNSLVILNTFENTGPKHFEPSLTLSLKEMRNIPVSENEKVAFFETAIKEFPKALVCPFIEGKDNEKITISTYPEIEFGDREQIEITEAQVQTRNLVSRQPDLIFTKHIKRDLSVQVQAFNEGQYSTTCIAMNDFRYIGNRFITTNGVKVVREIVNHTPSVFDEIDPFHQKIVQKSVLNGVFSNYYLCNPFLTKSRGIKTIQDPMNKYFEKFNWVSLASSLERISTGDIRRKFSQIRLNNSADVVEYVDIIGDDDSVIDDTDNDNDNAITIIMMMTMITIKITIMVMMMTSNVSDF